MSSYLKKGFHFGGGSNRADGIGSQWRTLAAAGRPIIAKSTDSYGPLGEALAVARQHNVEHHIIYRISTFGQKKEGVDTYDYDVPPYDLSPEEAWRIHWAEHKAKLPKEFDTAVWLETINEVDQNHADWLGRFAAIGARQMMREGYRSAWFAWSRGEPEPEAWRTEGMVEFLRLAADNPAAVAVALHEYSGRAGDIWYGDGSLVGRFQALFDTCDELGIGRPTTHITEWGWTHEDVPDPEQAMADIKAVGELYAKHPEIKSAAIWYLGPRFGGIAEKAQKLIAPYTQLALETVFDDVSHPQSPAPLPADGRPREDYRRTVLVLPQTAGLDDYLAVAAAAFEQKRTLGFSYDDAGIGALSDKTAVLYGIPTDQQGEFIDWYADHYPKTAVEFRPLPSQQRSILPIPHISQNNNSVRNDCGAACVAMIARSAIDEVIKIVGIEPDKPLHFSHLINGLNHFGIRSTYVRPLTVASIRAHVERSLPVIPLINYALMPPEQAAGDFDVDHFFVIIGHDAGGFYINDPLRNNGTSYITDTQLDTMMRKMSWDNMIQQGLLVQAAEPPAAPAPTPEPLPEPTGNTLIGLHASADPGELYGGTAEFEEFKTLRPGVIKVLNAHSAVAIERLYHDCKPQQWLIRAFLNFGGRRVTPQQFFDWTGSDTIRAVETLLRLGVKSEQITVELHNEPNLTAEGLGASWVDGRAFNDWFLDALSLYKVTLPVVRYAFPGLSPGGAVAGVRHDSWGFLEACRVAVETADSLAAHTYWATQNSWPMSKALAEIDRYGQMFARKHIWVTEASNNKAGMAALDKAAEYYRFWQELKKRPFVQGVTYFVASASANQFDQVARETWVSGGRSLGMAARIDELRRA